MSDATYSAQRASSATFGEHLDAWTLAGWPQEALLPGEPGTKRVGRWKARERRWVGMTGAGILKDGLEKSDPPVTLDETRTWPTDTVCVRGSLFPALDIDAEHALINYEVMTTVEKWLGKGQLQWRGRGGSQRLLTPFQATVPGVIRDWIIKFRVPGHTSPDGKPYLVELKGAGRQWLGSGLHPDGSRYAWKQGKHDLDVPDAELGMPEIDAEKAERLRDVVMGVLLKHRCEIIEAPPPSNGGHSIDRVDVRDLDPMVDLDVLERALKATPLNEETAGGYDQSIAIVAALRFVLGREGVDVPDFVSTWCIEGFGSDEWIEAKWHTLNEVEPEPAALMRYLQLHCTDAEAYDDVQRARNARQAADLFAAPLDPEMAQEGDRPAEAASAQEESTAAVDDELERLRRDLVHVDETDEWIRISTSSRMLPAALNASEIGCRITELDFILQQGDRPRRRLATKILLEGDVGRVDRVTFWPGRKALFREDGRRYYNFWRLHPIPKRRVTADDVLPFLRVLGHVMRTTEDETFFLDWGSFIAQNPGKKIGWALVLKSQKQGVGKDTLLGCIREGVVGRDNFAEVSSSQFAEKFTGSWARSQVVLVQEVPSFHQRDLYDRFKSYVAPTASGTIWVEDKYRVPYTMPNIHVWALTTNKPDALMMEATDRRFAIIGTREEALPEDIKADFFPWAEAGGYELIGAWLQQRPISAAFDPHTCPEPSDAKRDMMRAAVTPDMDRLITYLTEGGGKDRKVMNLQEAIMRADTGGRLMRKGDVMKCLELAGFELPEKRDSSRRINVGTRKVQVWVRGAHEGVLLLTASHRFIADRLLAEEEDQAPELAKATRESIDAARPKPVRD